MNQPKVLVLVPTISKVEPECLMAINSQEYDHYTTLVNYQKTEHITNIPRQNYSINSTVNRQALRKMALASDAEYFLFVDDDVVLPKDAIKNLVLHRKGLLFGWYRIISRPMWVAGCWAVDKLVIYRNPQKYVAKVDFGGLGCAMVSRKVLEAVDFTVGMDSVIQTCSGKANPGPCVSFCYNARMKGFNSYMCGDVVCGHKDRKTGVIVA